MLLGAHFYARGTFDLSGYVADLLCDGSGPWLTPLAFLRARIYEVFFKTVEQLTDFDLAVIPHVKGLMQAKRFEMSAARALSWPELMKNSNYTLTLRSFDNCPNFLDSFPYGIVSDGQRQVLVEIDVEPPDDPTRFRDAEAHKLYGSIRCLPSQCGHGMLQFASALESMLIEWGSPLPDPPR